MGTGTDVAIESAGITLLKGDLRGILRARKLSRATIRNIKQNLSVRFPLQRSWNPHRRWSSLSVLRLAPQPHDRQRRMSFSSVSVIATPSASASLKL